MRALANWLIWRAIKTPYFHLHHADGSIYMERYWLVPFAQPGSDSKEGCYAATWRQPFVWLMQKLGIAVRVHVIHTPDFDRHMHDHPWSFVSYVLRHWYVESRPVFDDGPPQFDISGREPAVITLRKQGSIAFRSVYDRHRIVEVAPGGVYTLFVTGPKRQSWGFFTERGWIPWRDYESVHNTKPIS